MYTRQRIVDYSDFSIKQINDNFSAIFLKLSGNIDTIDLKDGSITTEKIQDNAVTAEKIVAGSINVGHLNSDFVLNFPLLDNPTFISYSESVDGKLNNQATLIQQNSEQISLHSTKINGINTNISNLTVRADKIESNVSSIENNVSTHSSQITQLSNSISSKVSYTDYNGREIASLINQEAGRITISADAIDLKGITTIHSSRYPNTDYFTFYGNGLALYENGISRMDIYFDGSRNVFDGDPIYFRNGADFSGSVDFSGSTVYGLNCIESYYKSNKCYIDYGGGSRLTIRDDRGSIVGYITLE